MVGITPGREGPMFDEKTESLGGDVKEKPAKPKKPPTRAQKIVAWRAENAVAHMRACESHCTCTPTRAEMLLIQQWDCPPID